MILIAFFSYITAKSLSDPKSSVVVLFVLFALLNIISDFVISLHLRETYGTDMGVSIYNIHYYQFYLACIALFVNLTIKTLILPNAQYLPHFENIFDAHFRLLHQTSYFQYSVLKLYEY